MMTTLNRRGRALGLGLGVAASMGWTAPARAQGQPTPPQGSYLIPAPRNPSSPAGALLDRDLQIMRGTSLRPNQFLYGQYNPQFQVVTPPNNGWPGNGWPGNYYPPYYGGGYVGGIYSPFGYGSFGFGMQAAPNFVQREVIIVPEGLLGGQRQQPAPQRRTEPAPKPADDYYLRSRPQAQADTIDAALDDIRKAWLNGDYERLKARVRGDGEVGIFLRGQFKTAMDAKSFTGLLKDAMQRLDTVSFEFDRPHAADNGQMFVGGKHVWTDETRQKQETYISYVLQQLDGRWKIVEAGSSSTPVTEHERPKSEPAPGAKPEGGSK